MTQFVRVMSTKCRAVQSFLSQFVHGVSKCGSPLCFWALTLLKAKVLQSKLAKAWLCEDTVVGFPLLASV